MVALTEAVAKLVSLILTRECIRRFAGQKSADSKRAPVVIPYTVQPGDTLSQLARKFLGSPRRFEELEVARIILGHRSPVVTEIYAELDRDKALEVVERIG